MKILSTLALVASFSLVGSALAQDEPPVFATSATEQANAAIIQEMYDAFGKGDIPRLMTYLSADVEFGINGRKEDFPVLGVHAGTDGAAEFFKTLFETAEPIGFTIAGFYAVGDKVFVPAHDGWTVRSTGSTTDTDQVGVATLEGGKVVSFRIFSDTAQWVAAGTAK